MAGQRAKVHKALLTPLRERWKVDVEDGTDLEIQGSIVDHEYEFEVDGIWSPPRCPRTGSGPDTYGFQGAPSADTLLVLASTVALDMMTHPGWPHCPTGAPK